MTERIDSNIQKLVAPLQDAFQSLAASQPINLAYLHGSTAEGRATPLSDIDIAILLDTEESQEIDPYEKLMLEMDISIEIESRSGLKDIDVRIINDAPLLVQGRIVQKGHLLFSKDEDFRIGYETLILKKYLDFLPTADSFQTIYFQQRSQELMTIRERKDRDD